MYMFDDSNTHHDFIYVNMKQKIIDFPIWSGLEI